MAGRIRIGPRRQRRIYLPEWREHRGLTQKALGERLEPAVSDMTVSRWEKAARGDLRASASQMSHGVMAALAEALDIEPQDLYRHPDQPSADELLRGKPAELRDMAISAIAGMLAKYAGGRR